MIFVKSALSILAATSTVSALSLHPIQSQRHSAHVGGRSFTALHLEDRYEKFSREREESQLNELTSKRDLLKKKSLANVKPDDDKPRASDIERMSEEEFAEYMKSLGGEDVLDNANKIIDGDWGGATFKTKRVTPTAAPDSAGGAAEEEEELFQFNDYTQDGFFDENELHIPNRIGFTTEEWGDSKKGFVNGKLKKADRKMGKFNKTDLKKAYEELEKSGITYIATSETLPTSESLLKKVMKDVTLNDDPLVAATFPNPWKHAIRTRSRPRMGAAAVCTAAENACKRLGVEQLTLYQVQNPWYYIGGTSAVAQGLLEVIQEDHARYVGCVDMSVSRLLKIQKFLRSKDEFLATNQFEFSLTNRQNMGMIEACKKLGITPICSNVLDGGLASGKYTSTTPTGGEVVMGEGAKGPYGMRTLDKLDPLFKTLESLSDSVSERVKKSLLEMEAGQRPDINSKITTTQIAINYVRAKGAVPLVPVSNPRAAKELLGCLGWDLEEDEVTELEKACKTCGL